MGDNFEGNIFQTPEEANAWIQFVMNRAVQGASYVAIGEIMAEADVMVRGIRERIKGLQAQEAIHRARSGMGEVVVPGRGPAN